MPTAPRQMTAHTLDAKKGWPSPHAVDFTAAFDATQLGAVSGGVAFQGRCVHLNDSGDFEFGAATDEMAMFLLHNSDDPDVQNYGGDPVNEAGAWVPVAPTGKMTALVAAGAYELESTEFDTTRTYAPNDQLSAATGTTLATCGVLTNANAYPTASIVGVCSRGRTPTAGPTNSHGVKSLTFWPVYLPAHSH